jgi:N-acetylglucosamine-6-phosphate deacetylase
MSSHSAAGRDASTLITKFTNVTFLRNHQLVKDDLWVRGQSIIDPQARFWEASAQAALAADVVVDCAGMILAPGYIDVQLNGAFGVDFSNPADMQDPANTEKVCKGVLQHGVTSIYATIITSSPATYSKLRPLVRRRAGSAQTGAHILGLHLEGPFITVPGAHPPALIRGMRAPDSLSPPPAAFPSPSPPPVSSSPVASTAGSIRGLDEVYEVYGRDLEEVKIITLAPEIQGVEEVIRSLSAPPHNIVISAGHSKASYSDSLSAVSAGCTLITHLFNAMVSFHHRDPGLIGLIGAKEARKPQKPLPGDATISILNESQAGNSSRGSHITLPPAPNSLSHPSPPSLFYSLIVDGHHAHPASVQIAYSTHPRGAVLVTDAMCAMGLRDGKYRFGEISVEIREDMAHVEGTSTLAGSIATMEKCVQNFHAFTGCTLVEAIENATLHPAQCLRLARKGALDVGMDADLILLDQNLKVQGCWVMGECAWKADNITIKQ